MNLDFYRNIHEKEFRRKDTLAQRANTIITIMTTLVGGLAFLLVNFKSVEYLTNVLFGLLSGTSMIVLGISAYYLVKSYRVPPLNDIAKPIEWINYWNELLGKYKNNKGKFASADEEFTDHLIHLYADVTGENIDANFKRGTRLVKSNNALLFAFALLVVSSLTYYYNNYFLQNDLIAKGGDQVFTDKDAMICVPVSHVLGSNGGPGKRPVPDPSPDPEREQPQILNR